MTQPSAEPEPGADRSPAPRYRVASAGVIRIEPLDRVLTAVFHRGSGITHLLSEPAPQILDALAGADLTAAQLLERLAETFELADVDSSALSARLAELVESGLVEERTA